MCLYLTDENVEKNNLPEPLTAEEDIIVYKYLLKMDNGDLISPYQSMRWTLDEIVLSDLEVFYNEQADFSIILYPHFPISMYLVEDGLHAYREFSTANHAANRDLFILEFNKRINKYKAVVYEAVIPKGSLYYCNETEIASNMMKVTNCVKEYEYEYK